MYIIAIYQTLHQHTVSMLTSLLLGGMFTPGPRLRCTRVGKKKKNKMAAQKLTEWA